MTARTYADWGRVTLGEYAAIAILARPDAEALIATYWDNLAKLDVFHDGPPNRLTADGSLWLAELVEIRATSLDDNEIIRAGREFLARMGTMLTVNVDRLARA